jgi:hypothetical protein
MKIEGRRMVTEFVCHWCREPEREFDSGDLKAPLIVAPALSG